MERLKESDQVHDSIQNIYLTKLFLCSSLFFLEIISSVFDRCGNSLKCLRNVSTWNITQHRLLDQMSKSIK